MYIRKVLIKWILIISMINASILLSGCNLNMNDNPGPFSSPPATKKYPAAVMIGITADNSRNTVSNTTSPFPSGQTLYFSVRSFGGFAVKELYAEVTELPEMDEKQKKVIYDCTIPVETGKHDALGSIPGLGPGEYEITIYRFSEDIAASRFKVDGGIIDGSNN